MDLTMQKNSHSYLRTQTETSVTVLPAASSGFGHSVQVEMQSRKQWNRAFVAVDRRFDAAWRPNFVRNSYVV